ncbi:MAG TPA: glycoside hydrolase family 3 C-terminal domain-containing protein [Cyclobacteriaceae bacterium]|nr:glycoside hydrolase family 3 C-terminal domain-containing protein [Cyclobacteriaceae bacterium]
MTAKHNRFMLVCILACTFGLTHAQQNLPQLGKNTVQEVVSAMTLEEKVNLLVGGGMNIPGDARLGVASPTDAQKRVPGAAGTIVGVPRLGIPSLVVCDGPAGIHPFNTGKSRVYYATAWPSGTLLASSWDTTLVKKVGTALGKEAKEFGVDIVLAPGMNIHRNPLGGRNFEYYSEDPVITGNIAAAMINGIQSNGVGVSAKHFFANNQETSRHTTNVIASERTLREIYLRGWEIMVKQSNPWTVMSSYNLVNGPNTAHNAELLTTILRREWGYKGFVMSDWFGGRDAIAMMKAGNNLIMPGFLPQKQAILDAVKSGKLDVNVLDQNVAGILTIMLLSPSYKGYKFSESPDLRKNAQLSREAAAESMVLLKNNNALPIALGSSLALFGNSGYELIAGGTGSGDVTKLYTVSLAEGLFRAGIVSNPQLYQAYTQYLDSENAKHPKKTMMEEMMNPTPPILEYSVSNDLIAKVATQADHAIISIGRNAGEGTDRKVEGNYYLSKSEKAFVKNVADAFHAKNKKVIAVLNIAGPIDVTQWRDQVDAILLAWLPGLEGGNAITDVLTGKVNPSGKLATTFPAIYTDDPTSKNFPGKEFKDRPSIEVMGMPQFDVEVTHEEGVYVGYRYYSTFGVKPAYEFGYGLSYTDFTYSDLKLSSATFTDKLTATVTITNSGKTAGKEVVQLYIGAPTTKLDKPTAELKAFSKTSLLKPGESQTLTFIITPRDLASYQTNINSWVADAGSYTVKIGTSQTARQSATFRLTKDVMVEKTNKVLVPKVPINELKPVQKK